MEFSFYHDFEQTLNETSWGTFQRISEKAFRLYELKKMAIQIELIPLAVAVKQMPPALIRNEQAPRIRIWEDLWFRKKKLILARLAALAGVSIKVHARKTKVVTLNQPELTQFLTTNHLLGSTKAKLKYGLMEGDKLESVASFSKGLAVHRAGVPYQSFELIRFCSQSGSHVRGGFSKLLQHFIRQHQPDDIMTYLDADWAVGNSYEQFGFRVLQVLPPNEFWVNLKTKERFPSTQFTRDVEAEDQKDWLLVRNSGSIKYLLDLKGVLSLDAEKTNQ